MSELTLEALDYRADEANTARRIYDLTTPPERRAAALRQILGYDRDACIPAQPDQEEMPS